MANPDGIQNKVIGNMAIDDITNLYSLLEELGARGFEVYINRKALEESGYRRCDLVSRYNGLGSPFGYGQALEDAVTAHFMKQIGKESFACRSAMLDGKKAGTSFVVKREYHPAFEAERTYERIVIGYNGFHRSLWMQIDVTWREPESLDTEPALLQLWPKPDLISWFAQHPVIVELDRLPGTPVYWRHGRKGEVPGNTGEKAEIIPLHAARDNERK